MPKLRLIFSALCLGLIFVAHVAIAQTPSAADKAEGGIDAVNARLLPSDSNRPENGVFNWDLAADFSLSLSPRLIELAKAAPLYFVLDWKMSRSRRYWRDERVAQGRVHWRLSYNAITQQWRLSAGSATPTATSFGFNFARLDDALKSLERIRRERIVDSIVLKPDEKYELTTRLRLDVAQLPKPFQINAITNREWAIDSNDYTVLVSTIAPVSGLSTEPKPAQK